MAKRLDVRMVELALVASRQQAQGLIMAGQVRVNDEIITKAGKLVADEDIVRLEQSPRYVSRGAYKLLKALEQWPIDLTDKVALDIGASTGGFSQVMLEAGARRVYAVDVGYGQLAYSLRRDERVVVRERQNARLLDQTIIPEAIDFFSMDVSFISIKLILPAVRPLLAERAGGVVLIKPQFEAGRDQVGKGVITNPAIHRQVIDDIVQFCQAEGFYPQALDFSPIKGPKGNREFLLYLSNRPPAQPLAAADVVACAHREV